MHRSETVLAHVGVALGGGEIGMTEQFLDHPQIRPTVEKMGGESVPEGVGMGRPRSSAIDDPPDIAWP